MKMNRWFLAGALISAMLGVGAEAQQSRIIDDTALNIRWVLIPNLEHPAGPAHWVPSGAVPPAPAVKEQAKAKEPAKLEVLIHSGDAVTVLHETETSRLQLEAKALGTATKGERLRIRLKTGAVVDAVATAPGRVDLVPHFFARREP